MHTESKNQIFREGVDSVYLLFDIFGFDDFFFAGVVSIKLQFYEDVSLVQIVSQSNVKQLIAVLFGLAPVVKRKSGPICLILDNFLLFEAIRSLIFVELY